MDIPDHGSVTGLADGILFEVVGDWQLDRFKAKNNKIDTILNTACGAIQDTLITLEKLPCGGGFGLWLQDCRMPT